MPLPISDQQQPMPYLALFSHSTPVTDRQTDELTDGRTTTTTKCRPLSLQLNDRPKNRIMGCLHVTIQQTSSKLSANVFKIYVLMLDVCWIV